MPRILTATALGLLALLVGALTATSTCGAAAGSLGGADCSPQVPGASMVVCVLLVVVALGVLRSAHRR